MNQNFIMNQKCQIYSSKIYVGKKHQIYNKIHVRKKNTKFTSKFMWEIVRKNMPNLQYQYLHEKKTPNLQHQNLREEKKTPDLQHQNLRAKKKKTIYNIKIYVRKNNAKFTTSKSTWGKKTPNSQHQNLRGKKKTRNSQHQNLREKNKRQIYNIKIYVRRKKNTKFKTSKFTWKKSAFTTSKLK